MTDRHHGRGPERAVGALVLALALIAGARDLGIGFDNWDSYSPVSVGEPLPEFSTRLDDGSALRPADLEGQVTLLTFWATWCHACGLEMPILAELEERYADESDFVILGINRDGGTMRERRVLVEAYMRERELGFAQVYDDGQLASAFGVEQIPYMVIVDRKGQIRHLHLGRTSERTLRKQIDALLAE